MKIGKYVGKVAGYFTRCPETYEADVSKGSIETPLFTIEGRYRGKVVKVYDADTIHVVMAYPRDLTRFKVRLLGINAPEVRGEQKHEGEESKVALMDKIMDKISKLPNLFLAVWSLIPTTI